MKTHKLYALVLCCFVGMNFAQAQYTDYLGAGHDGGISVTTSDNFTGTTPGNTINGEGMQAELMEYSRFLTQTTFGSDLDEIKRAQSMGMEAWLDEQFNLPASYMTDKMWGIWNEVDSIYKDAAELELAKYIYELCEASANNPNIPTPDPLTQQEADEFIEYYLSDHFGPWAVHFNYAWSDNMINEPDQLRQRVAFGLSQIMVISARSDIGDHAEMMSTYYDILLHQSFGNFKDLLLEVTLSPAMGFYLSHLNNSKAIPEDNIHPDENYAREIMQLFSIGLYELNPDGSRKKDSDGFDIPTYNNADIKEMARIFTGLGPGALDETMLDDIWWTDVPYFGLGMYGMTKTEPMIMYEEFHDQESKSLMDGLEVPANQGGMNDIEMAVDFLFNHPNVGPFIGRQMIQRLVKSNPSPDYISRITAVFNDNGSGERGDMQAVIKAILLDPEARTCENQQFVDNGKLKEPVLKSSHLLRNVDYFGNLLEVEVNLGNYSCGTTTVEEVGTEVVYDNFKYWNNGFDDYEMTKQIPLAAPSVFNFYTPDHKPVGEMTSLDLVGPEFKIHDTSTAINYINQVFKYTNPWYSVPWYNWYSENGIPQLMTDFQKYEDLFNEHPEKLINHLDVEFLHGNMSDDLRNTMRTFVEEIPDWAIGLEQQVPSKQLIYFMLISPDYAISK